MAHSRAHRRAPAHTNHTQPQGTTPSRMVGSCGALPNFLPVTAIIFVCIGSHIILALPQIPNDQFQPNIYIQQSPTEFSQQPENRDYHPLPLNQESFQEQLDEKADYNDNQPNDEELNNERPRGRPYSGSFAEELDAAGGEDPEKSIPGSPEQDYPVFEEIPRTSFSCHNKLVPAYYADVEARCQVFHICDVGGHKHSFLCPNGSVFNQKYLVCDWWYDFACENAENLFSKQFVSTETTPLSTDVNNAGQTFQHDGLVYQPHQTHPNQNNNFDFNINPGPPENGFNTGFPQTQLDTPQQIFQNNYYVPQNDIFHGAETGFPGRDLVQINHENDQPNKKDENVENNENNGNLNITNNHNNQNVDRGSGDIHNIDDKFNNKGDREGIHTGPPNPKPNNEFSESKSHNNFQNNRDEVNSNRKQQRNNRRGYDLSQPKVTTLSSINFNNRENIGLPQTQEHNTFNTPALKIKNTEPGLRNIVNDTAVPQKNVQGNNNDQQVYRTEFNTNSYNQNALQTTANNNNFNSANIPFQPLNTFREPTNNFQVNQYRPDTVQ